MREKNLCGKMRTIDDPYQTYRSKDGWEWRVLKKYQSPSNESGNKFARWYCGVKSPFTFGSWEYGDVYITDIQGTTEVFDYVI